MQKAQTRDAARTQQFWFRKDITGKQKTKVEQNGDGDKNSSHNNENDCNEYELMTIDQIINGKGSFPGLVPLIHSYLSSMDVDADTHCTIQQYLKFIQRRASGKLLTMASWIRQEVVTHPDYKYVHYGVFCFFFSFILNFFFFFFL